MKTLSISRHRGFTLLETVIAIGVLAVLLTGFMVVFTPAAEGIRKSINIQQADRLASTLEQELVTLRKGEESNEIVTGFDKAFDRIGKSSTANTALFVYQYRGSMSNLRNDDQTPEPEASNKDKLPGKDYVVVPMMRRLNDSKFAEDLAAVEGSVYLVKCTQLVFGNGELKAGTSGDIVDPKSGSGGKISLASAYPEAVIAFSADFYIMPSKTPSYFVQGASASAPFKKKFESVKNPVFTRNLAVRR